MVARDVELRIVSALAKGFTPDVVARRLGQRASVAREVAEAHGYPDLGRLAAAADALRAAAADALRAAPVGVLTTDQDIDATQARATKKRFLDEAREVPELAVLVEASDAALTALREGLEAHRSRRRWMDELVQLDLEIAERSKRVAELRAKLKPAAAVVRAWARAHDVECPAQGRIPAGVMAAYALAVRGA